MLCEQASKALKEQGLGVLILVLMEDALRELEGYKFQIVKRLNPCSNGRCSARAKFKTC